MSDEIVFYHWPMSRGRMVHWVLEELGAPYRIELVNLGKGAHKQAAFLKVNPMGKLPAIQHRGIVVTETAAIITYLADAFPASGLAPALSDPQRGVYLRWMFYAAVCVDSALIDRMLARAEPERASALSYGNYAQVLDTLEGALSPGPYLLGARLTAADLYLAAQLGFGLMTKALEPRAVFQQYVAKVTDRPAHKRFSQQSEELMAAAKG